MKAVLFLLLAMTLDCATTARRAAAPQKADELKSGKSPGKSTESRPRGAQFNLAAEEKRQEAWSQDMQENLPSEAEHKKFADQRSKYGKFFLDISIHRNPEIDPTTAPVNAGVGLDDVIVEGVDGKSRKNKYLMLEFFRHPSATVSKLILCKSDGTCQEQGIYTNQAVKALVYVEPGEYEVNVLSCAMSTETLELKEVVTTPPQPEEVITTTPQLKEVCSIFYRDVSRIFQPYVQLAYGDSAEADIVKKSNEFERSITSQLVALKETNTTFARTANECSAAGGEVPIDEDSSRIVQGILDADISALQTEILQTVLGIDTVEPIPYPTGGEGTGGGTRPNPTGWDYANNALLFGMSGAVAGMLVGVGVARWHTSRWLTTAGGFDQARVPALYESRMKVGALIGGVIGALAGVTAGVLYTHFYGLADSQACLDLKTSGQSLREQAQRLGAALDEYKNFLCSTGAGAKSCPAIMQ